MSYPPQPGEEGYGQGTSGYGQSGAEGHGGTENYWAGTPQGALGPGAYVPPPDQPPPVVAYQPTGYPPPGYGYPPAGVGYPAPGVGYPTPGYGYGAPYGYLGQYPVGRPTDGMAIASLVVSCAAALGICFWGISGLVLGPVGAIFGHVAKRRIRASGAGGDGLALAGIIVGWIGTALGLIAVGLLITLFVMDPDTTTY